MRKLRSSDRKLTDMSEHLEKVSVTTRLRRSRVWLRTYGRSVPLFGPLFSCTAKNHIDSLKEFLISTAFGTATFTVTALLLKGLTANKEAGYFDLLHTTVDAGQLFIFAVGMLGPILLTAAEDPATSNTFPSRTVHIALLILIAVLSSGFYAQFLIARNPGAGPLINRDFLFQMSMLIASAVVVMRYLTIVYRKSTADFVAERDMPRQARDFAGSFAQRHGGEAE